MRISDWSSDVCSSDLRLFRISDYAGKIPNFSALQQNTRTSGLYIRGVGGNANNDGAEPGVGLIVDNVFFTHVGFSWLEFVDLAHVDLVRGLSSEERRVGEECVSRGRSGGVTVH